MVSILRLSVMLLLVLTPVVLAAQEDERYYPYAESDVYERPALLTSDTTLFYRAVQLPSDLYGVLTRHAFYEVAHARRGVAYADERQFLDGLFVSYRNFSLLRSLGLPATPLQPVEGEALGLFCDLLPVAHRVQLSLTDARHRFAVRYQMNQPLKRGWQLGLYADGRWGSDYRVRGLYTHTLRLAFRAEKRWGDRLRLGFVGLFAPTERTTASTSTREAFDLVGDNYYNPAWGFDRGEVRSARVRRELLPLLAASFEARLSASTRLRLTTLGEFGFLKHSSLGWFDARTPQPDNYRYMPSYFTDPTTAEWVAERWRTHDSRYTQIDWQELRRQNSFSRDGARYAVQDEVEGVTDVQLRLAARTEVGELLTIRYGLDLGYSLSCRYLELNDLLDADYLLDIDYYLLDDDSFASSLQNDLHNPNRKVRQGERFGYYYAFEKRRAGAFLGADYRADRWHADVRLHLGQTTIWRDGFYEKELYAASGSYGPSRKLRFNPYTFAVRVGYAFTPRRYLALSARIEERVPDAEDLFLQPEYNNRTIDRPVARQFTDLDLTYRHRGRSIEWNAAAFLHLVRNGIEAGRYYDDLSQLFTDRLVEQIGLCSYGIEAAATLYPADAWRIDLALSALQASYVGSPEVTLWSDRDNLLLSDRSQSYMGHCTPGGVPQLTALAAISYYGKGWGAAGNLSYAGLRYAHPDFMRRTLRVASQAADSEETFNTFMNQERLPDLFRVDLSAWKSFRLKRNCRLVLYAALRNLLGDESTPYDSYESHRIRRLTAADQVTFVPFDNRLSYAPPRSLYLSASIRF